MMMMMMKLTQIFILITLLRCTNSANILGLLPLPLYSHTNNFMPIFKELATRGHNVTLVSPFPLKQPIPNLNLIKVDIKLENVLSTMTQMDITEFSERFFQLVGIWWFSADLIQSSLTNPQLQTLIKDNDLKFDLVMVETFIFQEHLLAFGYKFNAPVINLHPSILPASSAYYTGNSIPFAYSPTRFSTFTDRMTFMQRVETTFFHLWEMVTNRLYFINKMDYLMRKHYEHDGLTNIPPLVEMLKNTSLTLIHHNSAVGYPLPLHRNVIEFGGINVKTGEKLPEDLQKIMDDAKNGVIYMSFGSFYNISSLSNDRQLSILSTLGKLKQTVLLKWNKPTNLGKLPENIVFREWYPQASILGHKNCHLFITHGGIASLMEGIYHAVPLLLIPLFADQKFNAKFAELHEIGLTLDKIELNNEEIFLNSINFVLNNSSYKENMKKRSAIFKDVPNDMLENVIYWIEYVIRHKGAKHLRPAVLDLYWFQALMLDVILFYSLLILFIIFIIKLIFKLIIKIFIKRKQNKIKKN